MTTEAVNPYLAGLDPDSLTTCDREPIHRPGSIQAHGALLVVRDGVVTAASANAAEVLGIDRSDGPIGARGAQLLGGEVAEQLQCLHGTGDAVDRDPFTPLVAHRRTDQHPLEVTVHHLDDHCVLELEPADPIADAGLTSFYGAFRATIAGLQRIDDLEHLYDFTAETLAQLTGYDRVMVYRFEPDDSGTVVGERRASDLEPFLGLRYPATDIPAQARRMYLASWLRLIVDVDAPAVPIDPGYDGDMTGFALRSISPVHLQYLRNMGVQATLTVSLVRDDRLWGLVACHHRTPKRISQHLRAACELFGRLLSLQVTQLEARTAQARAADLARCHGRLMQRLSTADELASGLARADLLLLELTGATGAVARLDGRTICVGRVPDRPVVDHLVDQAAFQGGRLTTDHLRAQLPAGLVEAADLHGAAGALVCRVGDGSGDHVTWFREELVQSVTWAGGPPADKHEVLTPRTSFAAWNDEVAGRSQPWDEEAVEAADRFVSALPEVLLVRTQQRLAHLAMHDPLTGLPNRSYLLERVTQALGHPGARNALLFIDLDRFKEVNDSAGHAAGDEVLLQAAARLRAATRSVDTVARLGGDEFVVLCEQVDDEAELEAVAERVLERFRDPFVVEGRSHRVTASMGIAWATECADAAELLRDADSALYQAKAAGRDGAAVFDVVTRHTKEAARILESELRQALDHGELEVHYQPLLCLRSDRIESMEALVRWRHPERGLVPAGAFLPVAEERGLLGPISDWVVGAAIAEVAGCERVGDRRLAINVTPAQLAAPGFDTFVLSHLDRTGLPAVRLLLEITESALIEHVETTVPVLERLRAAGVGIAIDDFGTGYSSLAYLRHLPLTQLKIDRSFVANLGASHGDQAVIRSVVRLARELELEVVAEGVETAAQLEELRELGVDVVQGWLVGRPAPLPAAAVVTGPDVSTDAP